MKKAIQIIVLQFCLFGCTLIPSDEYLDSDNLKSSFTIQDMEGTYTITNEALDKLYNHYNAQQVDSMQNSTIVVNAIDKIIRIQNAPMNKSAEGEYVISSSEGKLFVTAWEHEKFRFIDRPDSQYPNMKFRQKNGKNSILINLEFDPDSFDYYEYVLQE